MNRQPQLCHFFSKGNCIKGSSCSFSHQKQDINGNGQQSKPFINHSGPKFQKKENFPNTNKGQKLKSSCRYFLTQKGCKLGDQCTFMHNYHESLHHITREIIHSDQIVGCCSTGKLIK